MHDDDPEKMAKMRQWLDTVEVEVGVPAELLNRVERSLLDLISTVAHGPSRPGAPLTAFLIGVATGRGGEADDLIDRVARLAAAHPIGAQ